PPVGRPVGERTEIASIVDEHTRDSLLHLAERRQLGPDSDVEQARQAGAVVPEAGDEGLRGLVENAGVERAGHEVAEVCPARLQAADVLQARYPRAPGVVKARRLDELVRPPGHGTVGIVEETGCAT